MSLADDLARLEQMRDRGSLDADEFARAKHQLLEGRPSPDPVLGAINGLQRSYSDRWFGGVCGGLAVLTGLQSWIWRILFVLLVMLGGCGVIAYITLWIFVPVEPDSLHRIRTSV